MTTRGKNVKTSPHQNGAAATTTPSSSSNGNLSSAEERKKQKVVSRQGGGSRRLNRPSMRLDWTLIDRLLPVAHASAQAARQRSRVYKTLLMARSSSSASVSTTTQKKSTSSGLLSLEAVVSGLRGGSFTLQEEEEDSESDDDSDDETSDTDTTCSLVDAVLEGDVEDLFTVVIPLAFHKTIAGVSAAQRKEVLLAASAALNNKKQMNKDDGEDDEDELCFSFMSDADDDDTGIKNSNENSKKNNTSKKTEEIGENNIEDDDDDNAYDDCDSLHRLEFRLFLVYLQHYLELYTMFDEVDLASVGTVDVEEFVCLKPILEANGWHIAGGDPKVMFEQILAATTMTGGDDAADIAFSQFVEFFSLEEFSASSSTSSPDSVEKAVPTSETSTTTVSVAEKDRLVALVKELEGRLQDARESLTTKNSEFVTKIDSIKAELSKESEARDKAVSEATRTTTEKLQSTHATEVTKLQRKQEDERASMKKVETELTAELRDERKSVKALEKKLSQEEDSNAKTIKKLTSTHDAAQEASDKKVSTLEAEQKKRSDELATLKVDLSKERTQKESLVEDKNTMAKTIEKLQLEVKQASENFQTEIKQITSKLSSEKSTLSKEKSKNTELTAKLTQVEKSQQEDLEKHKQELDRVQAQAQQTLEETVKRTVGEEKQTLVSEVAELQQKLGNEEALRASTEKTLKNEIESIEKQLSEARTKMEAALEQEKMSAARLEEQATELKAKQEEAVKRAAELSASVSEGAKLVKEREKLRQELAEETSTRQLAEEKLESEVKSHKAAVDESALKHKQAEATIQRELDETKTEVKKLVEQKDTAEENLATLQQRIDEEADKLQKALSKAAEDEKFYKEKLDALVAELAESKVRQKNLEKTRDEAVAKLESERDTLQGQLVEAQKRGKESEVESAALREEIACVRNQLQVAHQVRAAIDDDRQAAALSSDETANDDDSGDAPLSPPTEADTMMKTQLTKELDHALSRETELTVQQKKLEMERDTTAQLHRKEITALEEKIRALGEKLQAEEEEVAAAEAEKEAQESELETTRTQNEALQIEVDSLRQEAELMDERFRTARGELTEECSRLKKMVEESSSSSQKKKKGSGGGVGGGNGAGGERSSSNSRSGYNSDSDEQQKNKDKDRFRMLERQVEEREIKMRDMAAFVAQMEMDMSRHGIRYVHEKIPQHHHQHIGGGPHPPPPPPPGPAGRSTSPAINMPGPAHHHGQQAPPPHSGGVQRPGGPPPHPHHLNNPVFNGAPIAGPGPNQQHYTSVETHSSRRPIGGGPEDPRFTPQALQPQPTPKNTPTLNLAQLPPHLKALREEATKNASPFLGIGLVERDLKKIGGGPSSPTAAQSDADKETFEVHIAVLTVDSKYRELGPEVYFDAKLHDKHAEQEAPTGGNVPALRVGTIYEGGPAWQEGLRLGDEIVEIAQTEVSTLLKARDVVVKEAHVTSRIRLVVRRTRNNNNQQQPNNRDRAESQAGKNSNNPTTPTNNLRAREARDSMPPTRDDAPSPVGNNAVPSPFDARQTPPYSHGGPGPNPLANLSPSVNRSATEPLNAQRPPHHHTAVPPVAIRSRSKIDSLAPPKRTPRSEGPPGSPPGQVQLNHGQRPFLGFGLVEWSAANVRPPGRNGPMGLPVETIYKGGPAWTAGLRLDDEVIQLGRGTEMVATLAHVRNILAQQAVIGHKMRVLAHRYSPTNGGNHNQPVNPQVIETMIPIAIQQAPPTAQPHAPQPQPRPEHQPPVHHQHMGHPAPQPHPGMHHPHSLHSDSVRLSPPRATPPSGPN